MSNVLLNYPHFKGFTAAGLPAEGYKVYVKNAGLTTDATSYSDYLCTVENTNPIILDAAGEAIIYVKAAVKLIYTLPTGNPTSPIWTMDYLAQQDENIIITADATPGTTNNNYSADVIPTYTSIPKSLTLILTPDADSLTTIPTTVFTGSGKNDCVITGPYLGTTSGSVFEVEIETNGSPDTVRWRKNGGSWTSSIGITAGVVQNMIEGMHFRFSEATGHTIGNKWTATVVTPARLTFCGLGPYLIYKNLGGTLTGLGAKDLIAGIPATLVWSEDNTCWILNNPSSETSDSISTSGLRSRKQETGNYTLLADDKGNLIDFINATDATLTLNPAANYNGMFFYIRAGGVGNVIIEADGAEVIYSVRGPASANTYTIPGRYGKVIQLQCNGVSWEVLMEQPPALTAQIVSDVDNPLSYTPTDGTAWVVALIKAGGGGGSSSVAGPDYGGGGGGAALGVYHVPDESWPVTITIGDGGAGGVYGGGNGNDGETTSFGALMSATPGKGGTNLSGLGGVGVDGTKIWAGANATPGYGGAAAGGWNETGWGNGSDTQNPGIPGTQGVCLIFEFPDYLAYLIPTIWDYAGVLTEMF